LLGLAAGGCRTLPPAAPPPLSAEDVRLAQALAHYAQGLLCEGEEGLRSAAALEHFERTAALDPACGRAWSRAAVTALRRGEFERAVAALERACRLDSRSSRAWLDLAAGYQIAGRLPEAQRAYRRAAALAPRDSTAYLALANIAVHEQRLDEALEILDRGCRRATNAAPLLAFCQAQGARLYSQGDPTGAVACLEFVAARQVENRARLYYWIGEIHEQQGQRSAAVGAYTLSSLQEPPLPQAFVRLALLYFELNPAEALNILREGQRRLPDNLLILLATAELHTSLKRFREAVEVYDRMVSLAGQSSETRLTPAFYLNFGAVCDRAGLTNKTEQVLENALKLYPDAPEVLNYLAYGWAERNVRLEEALDYVRRALQKEPDNGAYVDTLGWVYYRQGKYTEALLQIQRAAELIPDDPTIVEHLGDVYQALGRREEALEHWKRSFILQPGNGAVAAKLEAAGLNPAELLPAAARRTEAGAEAAAGPQTPPAAR